MNGMAGLSKRTNRPLIAVRIDLGTDYEVIIRVRVPSTTHKVIRLCGRFLRKARVRELYVCYCRCQIRERKQPRQKVPFEDEKKSDPTVKRQKRWGIFKLQNRLVFSGMTWTYTGVTVDAFCRSGCRSYLRSPGGRYTRGFALYSDPWVVPKPRT